MKRGAIILCGGKSSRMGRDKATLPFGPELMLPRIIRLVGQIVDFDHVVVVATPGQQLPEIPSDIIVTHDGRTNRGPLEGLAAGLRCIQAQAEAVYVTSCDVPLLVPAFVARMFDFLGENDIAVPFDGEHYYPLAAVYHTSVLFQVQRLLEADCLRVRALFDTVKTREVFIDELRIADPRLATLKNLNHPVDYQNALAEAGFNGRVDITTQAPRP